MLRRVFVAVVVLWAVSPTDARTKTTKITVEVKNQDGDPVDRAAVIVKPLKGNNKPKRAYELRTSQQGTAPLPPIEQGRFLIQVIAKGYQTHGETYTITEPERTVQIQLMPPQAQFSVHGPDDPRKGKP